MPYKKHSDLTLILYNGKNKVFFSGLSNELGQVATHAYVHSKIKHHVHSRLFNIDQYNCWSARMFTCVCQLSHPRRIKRAFLMSYLSFSEISWYAVRYKL